MLFLWVFGDNVEDALGQLRYLVFYLLCGVAGGLGHALDARPIRTLPLIGASGAVAGVVAAYLMLHPRAKVGCWPSASMPLRFASGWVLGLLDRWCR